MVDLKTKNNAQVLAKRMELLLVAAHTHGRRPIRWFFGDEELVLIQSLMEYPLHTYATFEGIPWRYIKKQTALGLLSKKKNEG